MGERRQRQPEAESEAASEAVPGVLPLRDLQEAVQIVDQELDRQQRVYAAAGALRDRFGATVQQVLTDLTELEERRAALAREVGELEARLVELRATVAQGETTPA
jgi:chromosome segregation ATPase